MPSFDFRFFTKYPLNGWCYTMSTYDAAVCTDIVIIINISEYPVYLRLTICSWKLLCGSHFYFQLISATRKADLLQTIWASQTHPQSWLAYLEGSLILKTQPKSLTTIWLHLNISLENKQDKLCGPNFTYIGRLQMPENIVIWV